MSQTYAKANHRRRESAVPAGETGVPERQPSMGVLRSGATKPTQEQLGRRVDLPDAMRSKMENAFGADLSAVKLYESQAVADAGSKAITQGPNIAFAPGLLDFTSYGGQALLGHEMSHVVSQARGEVTGGGFLNDSTLEARADREGAMATAGQTVAMPTASLSPVTAADAAGPMQAKDKPWKKKEAAPQPAYDPAYPPFMTLDPKRAGKVNRKRSILEWATAKKEDTSAPIAEMQQIRPEAKGLSEILNSRYSDPAEYKPHSYEHISNGQDVNIGDLKLPRMISEVTRSMGEGYSNEEIIGMFDDLMAPHSSKLNPNDKAAVDKAQEKFSRGMMTLKGMHYKKLKRMESTFGTLGNQMHPEDFIRLVGNNYADYFSMVQDTSQLLKHGGKYFDFENNPQDRELRDLHEYYLRTSNRHMGYAGQASFYDTSSADSDSRKVVEEQAETLLQLENHNPDSIPELEAKIHGPSMSPEEQMVYMKGLHKRGRKWAPWKLFGKFKPGGQ